MGFPSSVAVYMTSLVGGSAVVAAEVNCFAVAFSVWVGPVIGFDKVVESVGPAWLSVCYCALHSYCYCASVVYGDAGAILAMAVWADLDRCVIGLE